MRLFILQRIVTVAILYSAKMTANIKFNFLFAALFVRRLSLRLDAVLFEDYSVHSVDGARLASMCEELLTTHSTCNDVADHRVTLRQVRGEVHFFPEIVSAGNLPLVLLFNSKPWKSEVRSN